MNFTPSRLHPDKILGERGQMAIFIALIFQVLFVFFAMIVNIGLIVHDKINLQNSVDLAAYYGAQRQAELLNAIAHENYQIRQAWKLLSWRIRVLGDLGYKNHPMQLTATGSFDESSAYTPGDSNTNTGPNWRPTVCINHSLWTGNPNQNLCHTANITIPPMPSGIVIAPIGVLGALNIATAITTDRLKQDAGKDCIKTGPLNFYIAIKWVTAYRMQVAHSKKMIRMYADLLSQDPSDFKDISGKSVKHGTLKTLSNNLTRANLKALYDGGQQSFRFYNSMGQLGDRKYWLNEVPIYPLVFYTDFSQTAGCKGTSFPINGNGNEHKPVHYEGALSNEIQAMRNEPRDPDDLYHSIYGVEKNPWAMAYVGVYAETKPRKPYLPFGDPITLRAKAFAKPFGGRIGPWYYRTWSKGSNRSTGTSNDKIDSKMPPQSTDISTSTLGSAADQELSVPNYSRFPGDKLGLLSRKALSTFRQTIINNYPSNTLNAMFYSGTPAESDGLAMVSSTAGNIPMTGLKIGYNGPWVRDLEIAAIAPDLFDVTYYSVEQDSYSNYIKPGISGEHFTADKAPYDIGSLKGIPKTIKDQIEVSNKYTKPDSFWVIKNPNHLLTAWAPSGAFEYNFPDTFGKCATEAKQAVPGKCAVGGRVGYSVKIISEDYLKSSELALGGDNSKGPIINPPPESF